MDNLSEVKDYKYSLEKIFPEADDFLPLLGTDYVELYVGNAKQAAHFYKTALGLSISSICWFGNRVERPDQLCGCSR